MAQGGPIPGAAVRKTPPDLDDFGLVVRVVGGVVIVGPIAVTQGTVPWIVSDPPVEAALDTALSTRSSEATLVAVQALLTAISANVDVALSTRASEATLATLATEATSAAAAATLAAISANVDVPLSTRASEATLATRASEATLATRASEATLATRVADATITARLNTLGQKTMANSAPVVIASDQGALPIVGSMGALEQATFGALVVDSRASQIRADFALPLASNSVTSTTTNGGTAAQANASATVTTGANPNGTAQLQAIGRTLYQPSREIYAVFTAAFTTPTSANSDQRIGLYDVNNGFFIGFDGLTFGITERSATVDTFIARAAWNGDPLDGSAGSEFTRDGVPEAIDLTLKNIYRIRFGWLGSAPDRFEALSPDNQWVLFHTIRSPNTAIAPSIANPNLPITVEVIKAAADATSLVISTSSWDAGVVANLIGLQNSNIDGGNSSSTLLGGGAAFTGIGIDVSGHSAITVYAFADQQGSIAIQFSTNNVDWETFQTATVNAANARHYTYVPQAQFFRVVYTNGATPQGAFRLQTIERPAGVPPDNKYNTSGALIVDASSATVPISAVALPLPAGAATEATLATRATEATLALIKAKTDNLDVALSTRAVTGLTDAELRASAVPISGVVAVTNFPATQPISAVALPLPAGAATEATLALIKAKTANLDVALSTRAVTGLTDAELRAVAVPISAAALPLPAGAATEATLATRSTEATLATRLAEATFTARINTLGQKTMANSTPVVIASDQASIPVAVGATAGTLNNGAQTAVAGAAVSILAANANRRTAIIQNVGAATIRVGAAAVTNVTGIQLVAGATLILESPYVATNQIFAIREGAIDSTAFTAEVT